MGNKRYWVSSIRLQLVVRLTLSVFYRQPEDSCRDPLFPPSLSREDHCSGHRRLGAGAHRRRRSVLLASVEGLHSRRRDGAAIDELGAEAFSEQQNSVNL